MQHRPRFPVSTAGGAQRLVGVTIEASHSPHPAANTIATDAAVACSTAPPLRKNCGMTCAFAVLPLVTTPEEVLCLPILPPAATSQKPAARSDAPPQKNASRRRSHLKQGLGK